MAFLENADEILVFENFEVSDIYTSQLLSIRYSIFSLMGTDSFVKSEGTAKEAVAVFQENSGRQRG